jgi:uncharacterized protein YggT (Ycf19 family)
MLLKIVMVLRLIAFMVLMYLAFAWFVERKSTNPQGKIRAFFHIVCAPVAVPVSRWLRPGTSYERVLVVSMLVVGATWAMLIALNEFLVR